MANQAFPAYPLPQALNPASKNLQEDKGPGLNISGCTRLSLDEQRGANATLMMTSQNQKDPNLGNRVSKKGSWSFLVVDIRQFWTAAMKRLAILI